MFYVLIQYSGAVSAGACRRRVARRDPGARCEVTRTHINAHAYTYALRQYDVCFLACLNALLAHDPCQDDLLYVGGALPPGEERVKEAQRPNSGLGLDQAVQAVLHPDL